MSQAERKHIHHPHENHRHELADCRLCRIEVDQLGVTLDNQVLLKDVSLHIHCGILYLVQNKYIQLFLLL